MDQNDFYLVLPSNSSTTYYNENATSCFTTQLSRELRLGGNWSVALVEIHVPSTVTHIQESDAFYTFKQSEKAEQETHFFPHGIYDKIEQLANEINKSVAFHNHLRLEVAPIQQGYYMLQRKCACKDQHQTTFNEKICGIFGFEDYETRRKNGTFVISSMGSVVVLGNRPASLSRAIPDQLYVYTDVCEPHTIGDTQAALLRIVSVDSAKYKFGSNIEFPTVLDGIRKDSTKYFHGGYLYNRDWRPGIKTPTYRCNTRSITACPGKIIDNDDLSIVQVREHIPHPIEEDCLQQYEFRKEIYRVCETTFDPFDVIYNQVSLRNRVGARHFTLERLRS
ncbi:uncharacterized protein LOC103315351 isoform X2 [Nasonia vitripennis]|uniref:Uncharacterized protein n=1 Tax=Nasonia vitripennis TaxID=7425 RepID=A0A7M7T8Q0_NASVI|nr:uncharacterized protein LOC103315351 isoform X2 [Nasonia vitripennis]